jgi:sorbitol-specific phosphotransferase system component IIBC
MYEFLSEFSIILGSCIAGAGAVELLYCIICNLPILAPTIASLLGITLIIGGLLTKKISNNKQLSLNLTNTIIKKYPDLFTMDKAGSC